ncbi:MAG: SDR family NAD(P)-dependent oxidoreductase [bacterium]
MTEKKKDNYDNPLSATISGITNLFRKHQQAGELKPGDRLDGKTVLVDGASSGLGFAIATDCARRGARVIMACRSGIPEKGEKVKKLSGSKDVHMLKVDFADIPSVQNLVSEVKIKFQKIDILISNAGVVPKKSRKTPQGLEEMFMVNYFSKFILVNLLLQKECFRTNGSEAPRMIFVDSETHRNPKKFEWEKFGVYEPYTIGKSMEHYGYNKLLLATFSVELSRRLNKVNGKEKRKFSVFTLCPGPINSNIGREAPKIFHPLMKLIFSIFFRSPAQAAVPVIYLAASKDMEGKSFDYFFLMSRKPVDEKAADPGNGKKLWEVSEKLLRSVAP